MKKPLISYVIPIFNEEKNIRILYDEIKNVSLGLIDLQKIKGFEVIFVNDGSKDHSQKILEELKKEEKDNVLIIQFRKNFGQTPALKAGFDNSTGDYIVTLDGDLQNDPKDSPRMIEKLNQGYDVISGWRYNRRDKFTKKIFSRIINTIRIQLIGDRLHDYGCSLKIYRKECLKDLELYGELHRYITAYLYIKGYRVGEIKVNHRKRKFGKTKYGLGRGINGILDLFYLKFWSSFSHRPLHFFGRLGIYQWVLAVIIVIEQIIKAMIIKGLFFGPLLALASLLVITGLLTFIFGFLSEILVRIYYKDKDIYTIKNII